MLRFPLFLLACLFALPALAGDIDWTYDGIKQNSQDFWGQLSKDYAICDNGTQQSPINIGETKVEKLPPLEFHYHLSAVHIRRDVHSIEVDFAKGDDTLRIGGVPYILQYLTWHTPGEHQLRERFWLGEFQLVHKDPAGKLLIVSIMVNTDRAMPALDAMLSHIPAKQGVTETATFDPSALLPGRLGYYAYTGSLTYPPCTEGVEWRILKQATNVSKEQLHILSHANGRNARITQPVYMRVIKESDD